MPGDEQSLTELLGPSSNTDGASAALVGAAVGGPVGLVGGFVAGAVVGGGASWLASKTVQFASRKVQDG